MKVWQASILAVAASIGTACGDLTTEPAPLTPDTPRMESPPNSPQRSISSGSQTPPTSVPPEYQHYTWVDVQVDAGWINGNTAYGQVIVKYGGNNAIAEIDLSVRNEAGTLIASNRGISQASHVFPAEHVLYASTNVTVTPVCGLSAQATGTGTVFDSFFTASQGILTWGRKADTGTLTVAQPACPPPPPPPPPPPTPPSGGDGSPPPTDGTATEPPTYQPGPFVPTGHWECNVYYSGTDYEQSYCTWYDGYTRIAFGDATGARPGTDLAAAQSQLAGELASVFIVVSDRVPADAMAVIERRRQGAYRNVLLVPSAALRPATLVAALRALSDSRGRDGELPVKDIQLTLKGSVLDQQIPRATRDYAAAFAALLARAKRADVGPYGTRQVLEIRLADRN